MIFSPKRQLLTKIILFVFGLSYLSTFWSKKILIFKCFNQHPKGSFLLYENELCELKNDNSSGVESFFYNRQKFLLIDGVVSKLVPKTEYSFEQIRKGVVIENYYLYPSNEFKVPRPNFFSLFKEQCVSPLFSFQIFSSLLMCFDEHVLNSLISTAMIIFVEASFVMSRVSTMKIFRKLEHQSCTITRTLKGDGKYLNETVKSSDLRPGDRVVIDKLIELPCDMVILDGSCAVNEAMLSGESVPQFKEELIGATEILSFKDHKKHILFAGTKMEKLYTSMTCLVLRTAYSTEQGNLLNKMLQSDEVKYDPEALKFILLLSTISLINCCFTFKYSEKKGYALFIDLIILFTNSIPFELPMEMGLSVQSAVKNLMAKRIYCLEPFRITLAGKIDVCCFDKTGTLVDSKLEVKKIELANENTSKVLSCCHNLIEVDGLLRGDPLETAIFDFKFEKLSYRTIQQFSFTSELKRQGVLAEFSKNKMAFCMKGAPEQIEKYLKSVPENFSIYKKYAAEGYRIIALAYKDLTIQDMKLSSGEQNSSSNFNRTFLEKDLQFCGFILLGSSLREYAVEMTEILKDAGLKILMITGDNLLTALNVAEQLKITGKGVEGKEIDKILNSPDFLKYSIFGRADPKHKELIIKKYQSFGYHTMMVGDGTNDVGALKAADVGIAMLESAEEIPIAQENKPPMNFLEKMKAEAASLESIRPGDASMAAPFTVKSNSLKSIVDIIQQGRSSLVTTIQMYKILALNSIISAFFYMFVDVIGIKFSDPQMVSIGVLSSIAFTAITQPKALNTISKQKPITSIFSLYILSSILSQSIIQISSLFLIYKRIPGPKAIATSFEPSVMNTVLFIVSSIQTVSTLLVNYIGRPFREDLHENKMLGFSLLAMIGFIANIFIKFHPDINELIKVVDVSKYGYFVITTCLSSVLLSYMSERICFKFFMINKKI
jgi:cation-transporting ATPase 13A1